MENKIQVSFDQRGYELALNNYKLYKEAVKSLNLEAKNLGVTLKLEELESSTNPFTLIATKHFETLGVNLPNINPVKYLSMTDTDTTDLSIAANKYNELKKFKTMPLKDTYSVNITGEAAIKRYKKLNEVSDTLNEWLSEGIVKNPIGVQRALASVIIMGSNGKFIPQHTTR